MREGNQNLAQGPVQAGLERSQGLGIHKSTISPGNLGAAGAQKGVRPGKGNGDLPGPGTGDGGCESRFSPEG